MAKKPLALDSFIANEAKLQTINSPGIEEKRSENASAGAKKGKSPDKAQNPDLPEQPPRPAPEKPGKFKKKHIGQTVYLLPPVHQQLRALGFEEERRMHSYLMEGLDLVFRKRGLKSIAELTDAMD